MAAVERMFKRGGVRENRSLTLFRRMPLETLCSLQPEELHPEDRPQALDALRQCETKMLGAFEARRRRPAGRTDRDVQITEKQLAALRAAQIRFEEYETGGAR